ncbi:hypothetical protein [Flammeovirga pacifica]|uniref:Lipoprotein n=1 Tax=Flammeovirga pacifica TaxID=915059 RepID=A0A1S1YT44_FLAPC|nr:hypothetical protein [Flammeovirga pacifica]OHX64189.1 hypothetical protein NH26_21530 [Flammeovirga pacifica]
MKNIQILFPIIVLVISSCSTSDEMEPTSKLQGFYSIQNENTLHEINFTGSDFIEKKHFVGDEIENFSNEKGTFQEVSEGRFRGEGNTEVFEMFEDEFFKLEGMKTERTFEVNPSGTVFINGKEAEKIEGFTIQFPEYNESQYLKEGFHMQISNTANSSTRNEYKINSEGEIIEYRTEIYDGYTNNYSYVQYILINTQESKKGRSYIGNFKVITSDYETESSKSFGYAPLGEFYEGEYFPNQKDFTIEIK